MPESERGDQKLSPEEYRKRLLLERRRTMRTVRNALLGVAILAALWWLLLLYQDRTNESPASDEPVAGANADHASGQPASESADTSTDKSADEAADEAADGDREFSPFNYK